jgi:hypothetical protein
MEAPIETSPELTELAKALAVAQSQIEGAMKGKVNPHFRSKYADLTSVWEACREPLSKNGLSIVQQPVADGDRVGVVTTLLHQSGEWMRSTLWMKPERPGPQAAGSCITYCRRFSLASFVGVCPEDDDGEKAEGRDKDAKPPGAKWTPPAQKPTDAANDSGEQIEAGVLQDIRLAAGAKFKGKPAEARKWLRENFGTENAADLTKDQGAKALELLKAA